MQTFKQTLLRLLYPLLKRVGKGKHGAIFHNEKNIAPSESFYSLQVNLNNGTSTLFSNFKGKKVLLVNTASDCGYTGQYAELQSLHEKFNDKLAIIAFPSNDFAQQEKGSDEEIAQFCQVNYGVTFPLARKGVVVKAAEQQPVFRWLTESRYNGWNDHAPDWNFSKYLINEEGKLIYYFAPSISPKDNAFLKAVQ